MRIWNYLIVATFFSLWVYGFLTQLQQEMIALFLILTLGIIHGAYDIYISKKLLKGEFSYFKILSGYIFSIISFTVLFKLSPEVLLAVFVIFSAYHFGEQHWLEKVKKPAKAEIAFAFLYGFFILSLLLRINISETEQILNEISALRISEGLYTGLLGSSFILLLAFSYFLRNSRIRIMKRAGRELIILIVLAIIFSRSSLIWGFAVYFVVWHSIPSILSQLHFVKDEISWKSLFSYLKESFFYWIISLAGLLMIFFFIGDEKHLLLSIVLPFIAALTFPHAFIISKMFKRSVN